MRTKRLSAILINEMDDIFDPWVTGVETDSRKVSSGNVFICIRGYTVDGHKFAEDAVVNGASAVISEYPLDLDVPNVVVADTKQTAGAVASAFYDHPSHRMRIYGVTGTNGKTTTATLTYDLLRLSGQRAGIVSTIGARFLNQTIETANTTPEAVVLHRILADMVDADVTDCVLEVSSHALMEGRVAGIHFHAAAFTNLTHDHLDYHRSMDEYARAKARLFEQVEVTNGEAIVLNAEDSASHVMAEFAPTRQAIMYSTKEEIDADIQVIWREETVLVSMKDFKLEVPVRFMGAFNAANLSAAIGLVSTSDMALRTIVSNVPGLTLPKGRLERLATEDAEIYIDYAHTPDGLEKCLSTLQQDNRDLVVVLSAAGDRDPTKRQDMGRIASQYSNEVIVTVHDVRMENPTHIIRDLVKGIQPNANYVTFEARKDALRHAVMQALEGKRVVVVGKGHDHIERIGRQSIPFNESDILLEELKKRKGQEPAV
ncbi:MULTISPECIES: UDP-N-acetylmuramoyl-L-alanyl-D-glutamate--2,6-diaminopimelate ligase [unclassified Exiguobacterium]|uniref:UDP-N-acetylmuramoyl-L-alanyl-D-glutamate--2, 6-diaminopimelate ligase n=1 Tax=unclassified Exiguobacterium TaxID=2644629 RepID=UPI001BE60B67|nr:MULTISPECIES: UDP-N-acetylmuramoyl-L-alanyl-D-glutamate--2,6-diaminopimelate ligase [unclassified Exiguobacterium]